MPKSKEKKQDSKCRKNSKPCNIKGKIEVRDTRERKDGPGGN